MEFLPLTIIAPILLSLLVLLFAYFLSKKEKRLAQEEKRLDKIFLKAHDEADQKAEEIIKKAIDRAEKIILDAEIVKTDFLNRVEENLERVGEQGVRELKVDSEEFDKKYKDLFEGLKQEYLNHANTTLESVGKIADEELEDFRKVLRSETVESQELISKKISEEFDRVQKEIEDYKKNRVDNIAQEISTLVNKIAKDVLGKSLTAEQHGEIILQALENAKKDGLFAELQIKTPTVKTNL